MIKVIEDNSEAIAGLCRQFGVLRLYLFGSATRSDYQPGKSDIDLLVDFGPMDGRTKAHVYFDLLDELSKLLGTHVDLVMTGAVKNHYISKDIELTKQELYVA